jgi:hypothetical protein
MNSPFPIYTILPSTTRVSDAVRLAHHQGAGLYLTRAGKVIVAPFSRPGWRRLNINQEATPCAA